LHHPTKAVQSDTLFFIICFKGRNKEPAMNRRFCFILPLILLFCWCILLCVSCGCDNDDDDDDSSPSLDDDSGTAGDDADDDYIDDIGDDVDDDIADDTGDDTASLDDDADDDTNSAIWADTSTGLIWQNGSDVGWDLRFWFMANLYCENLDWGGYVDWRLPTIDELRTLIGGCAATETGGACGVQDDCADSTCWSDPCSGCDSLDGPGPHGLYWPDGMDGAYYWAGIPGYWSSTPVADQTLQWWSACYDTGSIYNISGYLSARCVH
jgi:hypothetical protein